MQQFMVDGSAHPFFSISSATPPPPNADAIAAATAGGHEIYHPAAVAPATNKLFNNFYRHSGQYSPQTPPLPHFPHFHSNIPITQQLFTPPPPQHHHHHHFQLFQANNHNHRRLIPNSASLDQNQNPENSGGGALIHGDGDGDGGPPPPFLAADMKFKLSVDDSCGSILHAENASESRLRSWNREDCTIKEPFW